MFSVNVIWDAGISICCLRLHQLSRCIEYNDLICNLKKITKQKYATFQLLLHWCPTMLSHVLRTGDEVPQLGLSGISLRISFDPVFCAPYRQKAMLLNNYKNSYNVVGEGLETRRLQHFLRSAEKPHNYAHTGQQLTARVWPRATPTLTPGPVGDAELHSSTT